MIPTVSRCSTSRKSNRLTPLCISIHVGAEPGEETKCMLWEALCFPPG